MPRPPATLRADARYARPSLWLHRGPLDEAIATAVAQKTPRVQPPPVTPKPTSSAPVTPGTQPAAPRVTPEAPHRDASASDTTLAGERGARALLQKHWSHLGDAWTIAPLPSYDDENWRVDQNGRTYALKIAATEAECRGFCDSETTAAALECEGRMMEHLAQRADPAVLRVPRVVKAADGSAVVRLDPQGSRFARLVTWVDGRPLSEFRQKKGDTDTRDAVLGRVGASLAEGVSVLRDFDDRGVAARRPLSWDLRKASESRQHLRAVDDPARLALADRSLRRFEAISADFDRLPHAQTLHGDVNDENVLVDASGVPGYVDFGDFVTAPRLYELAVCFAYLLFFDDDTDGASATAVLREAGIAVAAFHARAPLQDAELEALLPCVAARNCQTVLNSAHRHKLDPDDAYVLLSAEPAWRLLTVLDAIEPGVAAGVLRKACFGEKPVAQRGLVVSTNDDPTAKTIPLEKENGAHSLRAAPTEAVARGGLSSDEPKEETPVPASPEDDPSPSPAEIPRTAVAIVATAVIVIGALLGSRRRGPSR